MIQLNLENEFNLKDSVQNNFLLKLNSDIFNVFEEKLKENSDHCLVYKVYVLELKNLNKLLLKFLLNNIDVVPNCNPIEEILNQESKRLHGLLDEILLKERASVHCDIDDLRNELRHKDNEILNLRHQLEAMRYIDPKMNSDRDTPDCFYTSESEIENSPDDLLNENKKLKQLIHKLEKQVKDQKDCLLNDRMALVQEVADKHDRIVSLKKKNNSLEEQLERIKKKVQFREEIIKELRRKNRLLEQQNPSPLSITPPKSPELHQKQTDSCCNTDLVNNLIYRSNFLTVPGQRCPLECNSLSDTDQESNTSTNNYNVCHNDLSDDHRSDDADQLKKLVCERDNEVECQSLIIDKLESKLHFCRRDIEQLKVERDLHDKKSIFLRNKIKSIESLLIDTTESTDKEEPINFTDPDEKLLIEEELKTECDSLKNIKKVVDASNLRLHKITEENLNLKETTKKLRENIEKLLNENEYLVDQLNDVRNVMCVSYADKGTMVDPTVLISHTSSSSSDVQDSPTESEKSEQNLLKECETVNLELTQLRTCMVNQLKNAIQTHNETIKYLEQQKNELELKLEENHRMLLNHNEFFDELRKRNEELETENKNQLITISNLRVALEDLKRNENSPNLHSSNIVETLNLSLSLMSKQYNELYGENSVKDEQLKLLRNENVELKARTMELKQDVHDLMEMVNAFKNKRQIELLKQRDLEQLKNEERQLETEVKCRERDINCLKHYRFRCLEMESEYLDKMNVQKQKSDMTIRELEKDIAALTEQLIQSHQQTSHYEELMKETTTLQSSMKDLENQNDIMRKTIESYEGRFKDLQVQLEETLFENSNLLSEVENLKSDITDKTKRITELSIDNHKLEAEYDMQKKSCHCSSPKSSPEKRSSSTVMQINDLKNKLMNKGLDYTKLNEAFKRKSQQFEKLQKTTYEERNKLREQCLSSIKSIGELKSKVGFLEAHIQEQNEELTAARDRANIAISKMSALETELRSKSSKLEDLETREEKWRSHVHEISHEIQSRKEDALKREEKLIEEITAKNVIIKEQSKIIEQHSNGYFELRNENETMKQANQTLTQQTNQLKLEVEELRRKEKGLSELLKTTEVKLEAIKKEIFSLFNTHEMNQVKSHFGQMTSENVNLHSKYENLVKDYNKLIDENRTLYDIKNDTIQAIEIFKKLQEESAEREKAYHKEITKLTLDKRNLHKDRTRLTKLLLEKHRDMIILNSEIGKYRVDFYDDNSNSSLQPTSFQPIFYPSEVVGLTRASSTPDFSSEPILLDCNNMTEKIRRTRKFWQNGIQTAIEAMKKLPKTDATNVNANTSSSKAPDDDKSQPESNAN